MKALTAALAVAVSLAAAQAHAAAPITYSGMQTVGSGTATYSITTDGTLGLLASSDITGYSVSLTDQFGSVTMSPGNSALFLVGTSTSFSSVSPLEATGTSLIFEPAGGQSYFGAQLSFQSTVNNADFVFLRDGSGVVIDESTNGSSFNSKDTAAPLTIASASAVSAAPEPGTWALMLGGVGMLGAAMRIVQARRREDDVKGIATA